MENISCDLCGVDDAEIIFSGMGWKQPVPDGCVLVRCHQCGLMYLNPRPTPDEIGNFYRPDYSPYQPAIEDERFWLMRSIRRGKLVRRRRMIEKFSGRGTGSILDVGCSTGLFLHEMKRAGWETVGIEPNQSAAAYARDRFNLEVFQGTLTQSSYPAKAFNVVSYWDVLEHTFSPFTELQHTAELLQPGGLVVINLPNFDCPEREWFGPLWNGYDPPRHLYVFTRQTLTRLLQKTGFEPVAWVCFMSSYYSFIISLGNWLRSHAPKWAKPMQYVLNIPGMRFLFEPYFTVMNWRQRGSVISVFARKMME